jgi:3-oxoacyl-[acyl-carrier protein] reductase
MDLGLAGRKAIVCASSRGLGYACAYALAREGCDVYINGRDRDALEVARVAIERGVSTTVHTVASDLNTAEGRSRLIEACPRPDILVNNNAGPPPGSLLAWDRDDWLKAVEANMLAPILLIKAVLPGMRARRFGRIVNITSARVKTPTERMGLSTSARAGLTALCKGLSREVACDNVTINNLLPERIDTSRQAFMATEIASAQSVSSAEAMTQIKATIPAGRLGSPSEFGDACAFLCSEQAGYISGQNLQLDGGAYRGLI